MRAMPSPTCSTVPTSARSVSTSNCSIRSLRIEVISSGRSFTSAPCGCEFLAESVEPAAHAGVEPERAGLEDEASNQIGVDRAASLDLASGRLLDPAEDELELVVGQLVGGGELDFENARRGRHKPVELVGDPGERCSAALLREQAHEVDDELVGALGDPREDVGLHARVDLGVLEHDAQVVRPRDGVAQRVKVGLNRLDPTLLECSVVERAGVDALDGGYDLLPSSCEKSISASASSIRRRWSSASSDLRVIFSAAATLSLPT